MKPAVLVEHGGRHDVLPVRFRNEHYQLPPQGEREGWGYEVPTGVVMLGKSYQALSRPFAARRGGLQTLNTHKGVTMQPRQFFL